MAAFRAADLQEHGSSEGPTPRAKGCGRPSWSKPSVYGPTARTPRRVFPVFLAARKPRKRVLINHESSGPCAICEGSSRARYRETRAKRNPPTRTESMAPFFFRPGFPLATEPPRALPRSNRFA